MNQQPRVYIYLQHLLGTGHAVRAIAIARALIAHGFKVKLATGNLIPPSLKSTDIDVFSLPIVKAGDGDFTNLVDDCGKPIDDDWRTSRTEILHESVRSFDPDVFLTETFPFGRRQFMFELIPLLERLRSAKNPPIIAASIRDILVRKARIKSERQMADWAKDFYDLVFVHADADFIPLNMSFPFAREIEELICYTGYVYQPSEYIAPGDEGNNEIVVSAGGGAVGHTLFATAIAARPLSEFGKNRRWRILIGHNLNDENFAELQEHASDNLIIERARPDFVSLLSRAALSISQAGYNTTMDLLHTQTKAVVVPFQEGEESEQMMRAERLAEMDTLHLVQHQNLNPETLARAIDAAASSNMKKPDICLTGASTVAKILKKKLIERAEKKIG